MKCKVDYLYQCSLIIDSVRKKVGYCFNGLLVEYVASKSEQAAYVDLVKSLKACEDALDDLLDKYGRLSLRVVESE